jgi:hypothetical protein
MVLEVNGKVAEDIVGSTVFVGFKLSIGLAGLF